MVHYNVNNFANYKDGRTLNRTCVDCGKLVTKQAIRCRICQDKRREGLLIGINNPNFKDGRTLEEHHCIDCQKVISYPTFVDGKGRCRSCSKTGKLSPVYCHGECYFPYSKEFNVSLKLKIRTRDNFTCQECGIKEINCIRNLDVHHIDYNKENCEEDNLISLCQTCHVKTNSNRDYWFAYYSYKMEMICNTFKIINTL